MIKRTETKSKPSTTKRKDAINQKLDRSTNRAIIHAFRSAFVALDVTQEMSASPAYTTSATCNDSANVFVALTSYTISLEMDARLKQTLPFGSTTRSSRVPSTSALSYSLQLKPSAWHLVDTTTDGTDLAVYQYNDVWHPTLLAIVWKDGLQVQSLYAIYSIPRVTASLLSRPAATLTDDVDPNFGLAGYTVAVSLRTLDQVAWEFEGYAVDFPQPARGANETHAVLLEPHGAMRDKCRVLQGTYTLSLRTLAFSTKATNSIIVDVAVWDFDQTLRWCTCPSSRCIQYAKVSSLRPEVVDLDVSKACEAIELACTGAPKGSVRIGLNRFKAMTVVTALDVSLSTKFINATFGTSYGLD
ncbi:hypothetical protein AeMF1_013915 [Aphanomyces euteiches]|nr:hypothetical protein AeMF1_013915 [Aphanomyces euteiches]KAH9185109.1 hypothetical protein AeNC1_012918 [Aphanomyces euteiches]